MKMRSLSPSAITKKNAARIMPKPTATRSLEPLPLAPLRHSLRVAIAQDSIEHPDADAARLNLARSSYQRVAANIKKPTAKTANEISAQGKTTCFLPPNTGPPSRLWCTNS